MAGAIYGQCQMSIPDDMSRLSAFDDKPDSFNRKCKIICTMGPSCWDTDKLVELIDCGLNVCRLNFSHGDHQVHGDTVKRIREAVLGYDKLVELIDCGLNVCRLNFSHGDHEVHGATVKRIRDAAKQRPNKPVGILLDTKGPEIRTGFFREDVGDKIDLTQGQKLKLVIDYSFKGDNTCFAVSYPMLCQSVKAGNIILCADGSLSLKVDSVGSDH
eukprot:CAMPEP_0183598770 /NCGR_PEP_ID=MMETSP0371-20130417/179096_1 /TAXON_ID=268820 /ORGANISM="Peridinium aciculiferum, Strain PAER-2" /LENGTH=214 /DNA_ID=CAMNT_0025810831 /DNA_START=83 /DNA_END=725 /DNA_ORIENTATION=-